MSIYPIKSDNGKVGFISNDGLLISEFIFDDGQKSTEGDWAWVRIGELNGFIDSSGNYAIDLRPQQLDWRICDGRIICREESKRGCIDLQGTMAIRPVYDELSYFQECRSVARRGENQCVIDIDGNELFEFTWQELSDYFGGYARVWTSEDLKGFVDREGSVAIPIEYSYADFFSSGYCAVVRSGRMSLIDKKNTPQFEWRNYQAIGQVKHDRALVDSGLERTDLIICPSGAICARIPESIEVTGLLCDNGLIPVRDNSGKYGFLNSDGQLAINCQFADADDFQNGLARVKELVGRREFTGYVNSQGEYVIAPDYVDYEVIGRFVDDAIWLTHHDGSKQLIRNDGFCLWKSK